VYVSSFDDYESSINKLRKTVIIVTGVYSFILLITVVYIAFSTTNVVFRNSAIFDSEALPIEICKKGMMGIFNDDVYSSLVGEDVLKALKMDEIREQLTLNISNEEVLLVEMISKSRCKIVVRNTAIEVGLRAFEVEMIKNNNFDFSYKIANVGEFPLDEKELSSLREK